jgi:hypothetical protein
MTREATHDNEYARTLLAGLEPIWGEGSTFPSGPAAVEEVVEKS